MGQTSEETRATHTPGPLTANGNGVHTSQGQCVAIAYDPDEVRGRSDRSVAHANARLFAASPELLVSCKEAEAVLWTFIATMPESPIRAEAVARRNRLLAAVAKAEGRSK